MNGAALAPVNGADRDPRVAARWSDALLAAALAAVDPAGLGAVVRAAAGPAREAWLAAWQAGLAVAPRRLPAAIEDERLLGGLDLTATLSAGRPVAQRGLLAECDGGALVVPMAERLPAGLVARLAAVLDRGEVAVERDGIAARLPARFGLVLLDEGVADDERAPAPLADRLAFALDLEGLGWRDLTPPTRSAAAIAAARARLPGVAADDGVLSALVQAAAALGVHSLRAPLLALRAARAHAALMGRDAADAEDAGIAARLVLAPRATRRPPETQPETQPEAEADAENEQTADDAGEAAAEDASPPPPDIDPDAAPPPPADAPADATSAAPLDERVLEAALAALPPHLLAELAGSALARGGGRAGAAGVSGALQRGARGRPIGVRRAKPRAGQRLDLVATLRAAAPWQRLRAAEAAQRRSAAPAHRVHVRADDFHVRERAERRETTAIFAVDASGSQALARLAEAKGAVEWLLADCYVRRDRVALIAFRGRSAELLLPPTRSLVRAKRSLAGLPGGGGTPLAAGVDAAAALADAVRRRGDTPLVVLLTDGRANVGANGQGGRPQAEADAWAAARRLRGAGFAALVVDTSAQPAPQAARLAAEMGARYVPLPARGGSGAAQQVARLVREQTG